MSQLNRHTWYNSLTNRGWLAYAFGVILTLFYVVLYWFPEYLGLGTGTASNTGLVGLFDPLAHAIKGKPANEWFVYGTLYSLAVLVFGIRVLVKYRTDRYQTYKTISLIMAQLLFAYMIPEILEGNFCVK